MRFVACLLFFLLSLAVKPAWAQAPYDTSLIGIEVDTFYVDAGQKVLLKPSKQDRKKLYILHETVTSLNRMKDILEEEMGILPPIKFADGSLHQGFSLPQHKHQVQQGH